MSKRTKLELTWIGKTQRPRLEPRILLEEPERSYQAKKRVSENDIFDNRLIFGDNLLALKALEQEFAGSVKCIFIDPPYNTGSAFTHYDDGIEHSLWLSLMRDRLEILWNLLAQDGALWISIDDNECHYLKVLCDEVFGRNCFVASMVWEKIVAGKTILIYLLHTIIFCCLQKIEKFGVNPEICWVDLQIKLRDTKIQTMIQGVLGGRALMGLRKAVEQVSYIQSPCRRGEL